MPLNSEGIEVVYTSNEEIGYLMESPEKDHNVEFIGFIKSVQGLCPAVVNNKKDEVFKCIITNGTYNLELLIWDDKKIDDVSKELVAGKIVHLDGCQGQVVTQKKHHSDNNLIAYEIIIQPKSVVEFMGMHVHRKRKETIIPTVEFKDIAKAVGQIKVRAYLKTIVSVAYNRDGPLGFGSGSITDGIHKLPVRVSTFKTEDSANHTKGLCAMVTGTISRTEPLTLICQNISCFELMDGEKPLDKALVFKANKPLKRCAQSDKNDDVKSLKKRSVLQETNV